MSRLSTKACTLDAVAAAVDDVAAADEFDAEPIPPETGDFAPDAARLDVDHGGFGRLDAAAVLADAPEDELGKLSP